MWLGEELRSRSFARRDGSKARKHRAGIAVQDIGA